MDLFIVQGAIVSFFSFFLPGMPSYLLWPHFVMPSGIIEGMGTSWMDWGLDQ